MGRSTGPQAQLSSDAFLVVDFFLIVAEQPKSESYYLLLAFYISFIMFMNPKIFKSVRFNSYITEYQKELLNRLSQKEHRPITDLVREAIHCWLRDRGVDDGLSYDEKDDEKRLAEIFPWWRKEEEEEKDADLEELRRLAIEQMK